MGRNKTQEEMSDAVHFEGEERRKMSPSDSAFNDQFSQKRIYVNPGETLWLKGEEEMLVTTVGSGVVLSIYEEKLKFGVLSHFVLTPPMIDLFPNFRQAESACMDEVCAPIEKAVQEIKKYGAGKKRIRVRLFGGAELPGRDPDEGLKNYVFIKEYLSRKGLSVMSEDIGGTYLRRVHFFPHNGNANRFILRRKEDVQRITKEQSEYFDSLNN
jgi:chemotaxis protein CheD